MLGEGRLFTEGYGEIRLKAVSGIMLTVLLVGILTSAFNIQIVKASGTIFTLGLMEVLTLQQQILRLLTMSPTLSQATFMILL